MQVKSSKGSILQYFRHSLNHLSLRSLFCLFLSGHFTQVLLYTHTILFRLTNIEIISNFSSLSKILILFSKAMETVSNFSSPSKVLIMFSKAMETVSNSSSPSKVQILFSQAMAHSESPPHCTLTSSSSSMELSAPIGLGVRGLGSTEEFMLS